MSKAIHEAETAARILKGGEVRLAPITVVCDTVSRPQAKRPPDQVSVEEKTALVQACADILKTAKHHHQYSRVTYEDMAIERYVVTGEGTAIVEPRLLVVMEVEVVESVDNSVCRAVEYMGGTGDFEDLSGTPQATEQCLSRLGRTTQATSIAPSISQHI